MLLAAIPDPACAWPVGLVLWPFSPAAVRPSILPVAPREASPNLLLHHAHEPALHGPYTSNWSRLPWDKTSGQPGYPLHTHAWQKLANRASTTLSFTMHTSLHSPTCRALAHPLASCHRSRLSHVQHVPFPPILSKPVSPTCPWPFSTDLRATSHARIGPLMVVSSQVARPFLLSVSPSRDLHAPSRTRPVFSRQPPSHPTIYWL